MAAAQPKSPNERAVSGATADRGMKGDSNEAALAAICHELSERLTAIGNYVGAARRLCATEPPAISVSRHVEILEKALAQVHVTARVIAKLRQGPMVNIPRALPITPKIVGPTYRIHFMNEFSRANFVARACQRSITIRSARSPERAVEAAKKRFARTEHIPHWRIHAQTIELEVIGAESPSIRTLLTVKAISARPVLTYGPIK